MPYNFTSRLDVLNSRMKELNAELVDIEAERVIFGIPTRSFLLAVTASPILLESEELSSNGMSLIGTQVMAFGFDVADLDWVFPPKESTLIYRSDSSVYKVMKMDQFDSIFRYTTNSKDRILLYTRMVTGS